MGGEGKVIVEGESVKLSEGTLVLILRGERHEIRNMGKEPLKTLSVYVYPAHKGEGNELPPGKAR